MLYCCIVVLLPTLKKASKTSQGKGGFFNASALILGQNDMIKIMGLLLTFRRLYTHVLINSEASQYYSNTASRPDSPPLDDGANECE